MKLSAAQQRVVDLMRDGHKLCIKYGPCGGCWIPRKMEVNFATAEALKQRGIIEHCGHGERLSYAYRLTAPYRKDLQQ